jgi:hypothetical protein
MGWSQKWSGVEFAKKKNYLDHPFSFYCKFGKMPHCRSVVALLNNAAMCRGFKRIWTSIFCLIIRQWLNEMITRRWIVGHELIEWPPISPDLSALDFVCVCVWALVSVVHANLPRTNEELKNSYSRKVWNVNTLHAIPTNKKTSICNRKAHYKLRFEDFLE